MTAYNSHNYKKTVIFKTSTGLVAKNDYYSQPKKTPNKPNTNSHNTLTKAAIPETLYIMRIT